MVPLESTDILCISKCFGLNLVCTHIFYCANWSNLFWEQVHNFLSCSALLGFPCASAPSFAPSGLHPHIFLLPFNLPPGESAALGWSPCSSLPLESHRNAFWMFCLMTDPVQGQRFVEQLIAQSALSSCPALPHCITPRPETLLPLLLPQESVTGGEEGPACTNMRVLLWFKHVHPHVPHCPRASCKVALFLC